MPYIVFSYYCGGHSDDNNIVRCDTWNDVKEALEGAESVVRWIVKNVKNLAKQSVIDINEGEMLNGDVYAHYVIMNLTNVEGRRRTFNKIPAGYENSDDEEESSSKKNNKKTMSDDESDEETSSSKKTSPKKDSPKKKKVVSDDEDSD